MNRPPTSLTPLRVLAGREAERDVLERVLESVLEHSAPQVARVAGPAGIGKTRLVDEVEAMAAGRGFVTLRGRGVAAVARAPFGVFRRCVEPWVADGAATLGSVHDVAGRYVLGMEGSAAPGLDREPHPDELVRAATRLLALAAGDHPLLVVIEDAQWADPETLQAACDVVTVGVRAAVVVTARRDELRGDPAVASCWQDLARVASPTDVDLEPLPPAGTDDLVADIWGERVDAATVGVIHRRSGGNPFVIEQLVGTLRADRSGARRSLADAAERAALPASLLEAVAGRLAHLEPAHRRLLELAVVAGDDTPFELLEALAADEAIDDPVAGLQSLVDDGLVHETPAGRVGVTQPLVREAVLARVVSPRRRDVHARALAVLRSERWAEPVEDHLLCVHAHGAGDRDATARHARAAAAGALATGMPRHALQLARLGLTASPDELALASVAARAAERLGQMVAACDHALTWRSAAEAVGDAPGVADACGLVAWARWSTHDRDGAFEALTAAERAADGLDETTRGRVRALRARLHLLHGDNRDAVDAGRAALALTDDDAVRADALVTIGTALGELSAVGTDEPAAAAGEIGRTPADALIEGRDLAVRIGAVDTALRAINNSMFPDQGVVDFAGARDAIRLGHELVARYGAERFAGKLATAEAFHAVLDGDADAARRALRRPSRSTTPLDTCFAACVDTFVAAETGEVERAARIVAAEARDLLDVPPGEDHLDLAWATVALACATDDVPLATRALERASASVAAASLGGTVTWWDTAVLALDTGVDPDLVELHRAQHAPPCSRRHQAAIAHLDAALAEARGDFDQAIELYGTLRDEQLGARPAALVAEAHRHLAELTAARDPASAREEADAALRLLERWPGHRQRRAAATAERLARIDLGRRRDGPLTARERQVAELVARGLTNREIGDALYISVKTASVHVSNILAKLGLRRRTQIAEWFHRS